MAVQLLQQYGCPPSAFAASAGRSSRSSEDASSCSLAELRRQPSAAHSDGTAASCATAMDRSASAPSSSLAGQPPSPRSSMDAESGCLSASVRLSLASSFYRSATH